jgi:hypothetical protein
MRRSMRSRRRSGRSRRTRGTRRFRARVKRVVMSTAETKYFDVALENLQLYHNLGCSPNPPGVLIPLNVTSVGAWFNPWALIDRGTDRFNRIGEEIMPRGIAIKMYLAAKTDRPNTMFRVIVASLPKLVGTTVTTNVFDPFQIANSGVNGNNMIWPADKDEGVKFLYDKIHRLPLQAEQVNTVRFCEKTKMIKLWIKSKGRKITYATFTQVIVNRPLAVYVIPYEQYSTLTTDNVGSMAGMLRMYYKDV